MTSSPSPQHPIHANPPNPPIFSTYLSLRLYFFPSSSSNPPSTASPSGLFFFFPNSLPNRPILLGSRPIRVSVDGTAGCLRANWSSPVAAKGEMWTNDNECFLPNPPTSLCPKPQKKQHFWLVPPRSLPPPPSISNHLKALHPSFTPQNTKCVIIMWIISGLPPKPAPLS